MINGVVYWLCPDSLSIVCDTFPFNIPLSCLTQRYCFLNKIVFICFDNNKHYWSGSGTADEHLAIYKNAACSNAAQSPYAYVIVFSWERRFSNTV